MTKNELMEHARNLGLKVNSKATKGEIEKLVFDTKLALARLHNAGLSGNARQRRVARRRRASNR